MRQDKWLGAAMTGATHSQAETKATNYGPRCCSCACVGWHLAVAPPPDAFTQVIFIARCVPPVTNGAAS